jgi:luciferase family oxidoreductase group 1
VKTITGMPLSVLDLCPVASGSAPGSALHDMLQVARHAEALGYRRYWLAEHHGVASFASSATAVLIGAVADATRTIRVGSGGVMLPNHAPLVIAEQFGSLEALHPGRIDLGVGRASGSGPAVTRALRGPGGEEPNGFPPQLAELRSYFNPDEGAQVRALPAEGNEPALWLLGSGTFSAHLAGSLGLPFAYAYHFNTKNLIPAFQAYRENFRPSAVLDRPHTMLCAAVICADTEHKARWIAGPNARMRLGLHGEGHQPIPVPTPQEAADYPYTDTDRASMRTLTEGNISGTPAAVRTELEAVLANCDADELMVLTITHGIDERKRSLELLAQLAAGKEGTSPHGH